MTRALVGCSRHNVLCNSSPVRTVLVDCLHELLILFFRPETLRRAVCQAVPPTAAAIFVRSPGDLFGYFAPQERSRLIQTCHLRPCLARKASLDVVA
jgi:hypothetical protein